MPAGPGPSKCLPLACLRILCVSLMAHLAPQAPPYTSYLSLPQPHSLSLQAPVPTETFLPDVPNSSQPSVWWNHFTNRETKIQRNPGSQNSWKHKDPAHTLVQVPKCPWTADVRDSSLKSQSPQWGQGWDTWGSPSSRAFRGDLLPLFSTGSVWCWPASHRGPGIPTEQPHFSAPWSSPHFYHTGSHASYLRARLPAAFKETHDLPLADCNLAERS